MMNGQDSFPQELCVKPLALIGFSGLDTRNNAVHKSIWETFSGNKRAEIVTVNYKLIDNAYEFPVVKPKRNSYEWYIPKGILKRNWIDKHLNKIPSVIVIFYELDWDDAQWSEKMIECASRVQSMRVALEGRNTKICVVLIQSKPPIPGDDPVSAERAVSLCSSCELNSKALFILPHGDHLAGYASRLETAFYDLSQNYYHAEARNIKSHREHLNKNTHQNLFVRHQFKMGFLNEMKQDIHTAHKHYTHAYNNLLEIRIVDTNAMEIRTVAGFINYKLCRLMFSLNLPRDAISQFKAHTERFKKRLGFQELAFEHHAWMSKQFSVFGDIFDEAVKSGLPAVQIQHPGIYYQLAVQHAILRKKSCDELCSNVDSYPVPDPLEGVGNVEYYGQRPWRPGKMNSEPADPHIENNGIKALQFIEKKVNHSAIIIALYGLAVSQFKTYRCPRTRRQLIVQMADEYYNSGDYGKALTLLTHMLWDYRTERWWNLLAHILQKALQCAYLTARTDDYLLVSLELLNKESVISFDDKKRIFENLNRILSKKLPEKEPEAPEDTQSLWAEKLKEFNGLSLDLSNIVTCVDCKARFLQERYQADEKVIIEVYVRNMSDFPMSFQRIVVNLNDSVKSMELEVDQKFGNNPNFVFDKEEIKKYTIEFVSSSSQINKELQISSVNLFLGNIDLKLSGSGSNKNSTPMELLHFKPVTKGTTDFDNIRPVITTAITPRISKLKMTFEHAKPALVYEWYKIDMSITNERNYVVTDLEFEISLVDDDGVDSTEFSTTFRGPTVKLPIVQKMDDLRPGETQVTQLFMKSHNEGDRNIKIRATFNLLSDEKIPSLTEEVIPVPVVKPFEITTYFMSTLFENVSKLYVGEDFVVMPVINCLSPWPIIIENTQLEFGTNMEDLACKCDISGLLLLKGETGTETYLARTNKRSDIPITIGQYTITWKRENGESTLNCVTILGPTVDWISLSMSVKLPSHGFVRTPMLVQYRLQNKSTQIVHVDISIESSEAFMFAGFKQFQICVLPESEKLLKYNLYPLIAGRVSLPRLLMNIPEGGVEQPGLVQEELNSLLSRLPTHIYVMPQLKKN